MSITINLDKAKDLTKNRIRNKRRSLLEAQDVLYMRAQEAEEDTTDIVTEKQRLRDLPEAADSSETTVELKELSDDPVVYDREQ